MCAACDLSGRPRPWSRKKNTGAKKVGRYSKNIQKNIRKIFKKYSKKKFEKYSLGTSCWLALGGPHCCTDTCSARCCVSATEEPRRAPWGLVLGEYSVNIRKIFEKNRGMLERPRQAAACPACFLGLVGTYQHCTQAAQHKASAVCPRSPPFELFSSIFF